MKKNPTCRPLINTGLQPGERIPFRRASRFNGFGPFLLRLVQWSDEARRSRLVITHKSACGFSIPKGLCPPAQGCEGRATLGQSQPIRPTPTGLRLGRRRKGRNPVGVGKRPGAFTQGSSSLATLGSGPESLWDSSGGGVTDLWVMTRRERRAPIAPDFRHSVFRFPIKTVETVGNYFAAANTGLKPGVNETKVTMDEFAFTTRSRRR